MGENPYVGPRPLELGEKLWGRDEEIAALYYLLGAERIVLLHSPSGAGKSSLVQAGLIPRLRGSFDVWRPTRVNQEPGVAVPGGRALNRYVHSALLGFEEGIPQGLRRAPEELAGLTLAGYAAGRPKRPDAPPSVVVIFDQFEEVLTVDPLAVTAKQGFFDQLGELLRDPQIWALFLLREDYLAPLGPYADRVPTHLKNRFRVDLLGLAAAREAIINPAREKGRTFPAADKLVHDLAAIQMQQPDGSFVEEIGHHVEPVQLQVVCHRLWDALPEDDLAIEDEDLARFGDIDEALADYYADAVARSAAGDPGGPRGERAIRDWCGERLITAGGIRAQVLKGAGESEGLANDVVEQLRAAHLVRTEKRAGATWCELAHDRLIKPVRENNAAWRAEHLSAVQRRAALWEGESRSPGLLLAAAELAAGEAWAAAHAAALTDVERRYLAASAGAAAAARREALQARRIRKLGIAAMALAAAALLGGGFAGWQWSREQKQARSAEDLVRGSVAASLLAAQPAQAGLVLLDVREAHQAPSTVAALHQALAALAGKEGYDTLATLTHEGDVLSASFSADGRLVATASKDGTARIWDAETGKPLGEPLRHDRRQPINSVAFSPDGGRVVTASDDHLARLWDVKTGLPLGAPMRHDDKAAAASFSPDGSRIVTASADLTARLWTAAGEPLRVLGKHAKGVNSASFSRDGSRLVTASWDGTAQLWDAATGEKLGEPLRHEDGVRSAAFSPDGRRVVTTCRDGAARVWDVATGKLVGLPLRHPGLRSASFSPDGSTLITASDDQTARLWDLETGRETGTLEGHTAAVRSAAFRPDGLRLVTASSDNTARLWAFRTRAMDGEELAVLRGWEKCRISTVAFRDNRSLVAACKDGTVRVRDALSGAERSPGAGDKAGILSPRKGLAVLAGRRALAVSPDGTRIATASMDKTARVWDAATGKLLAILTGHGGNIAAASFSPDGRRVVTASADRTARLWDAATGGLLATLLGHEREVTAAAFSPDGRRIATASMDATVRVWANPSDSTSFLLGRLRARSESCLDPAVRRDALGETAEEERRDTQACKRCVPVFFARLGEAPESRPESYVEAWQAYRECRGHG